MARSIGRVLALDVGKRRIGLALSDLLGLTAQGQPTLHRVRVRDDIQQLATICRDQQVKLILIGRPLHMSGDESAQGRYTADFGTRLQEKTGLPVEYLDERLTSVQATRMLRESGTTTDRRTGNVDRMAAMLLLQGYLDTQNILLDAEEPEDEGGEPEC